MVPTASRSAIRTYGPATRQRELLVRLPLAVTAHGHRERQRGLPGGQRPAAGVPVEVRTDAAVRPTVAAQTASGWDSGRDTVTWKHRRVVPRRPRPRPCRRRSATPGSGTGPPAGRGPGPPGAVTGELGRPVRVDVRRPDLHQIAVQRVVDEQVVQRLRLPLEAVRVRRRRHVGDQVVPEVVQTGLVERRELVRRGVACRSSRSGRPGGGRRSGPRRRPPGRSGRPPRSR